jgi:hypothetical protein
VVFLRRLFLKWMLRLLSMCALRRMRLVFGSIVVVDGR